MLIKKQAEAPYNIIIRRSDYSSDELFFEAISNQVKLLLKSNYVSSIYYDQLNKEVLFEFASGNPESLSVLPFWLTPEEYANYLALKDLDGDDKSSNDA